MDKKDIISILYSNDIKLITDTLLYITYNVDEWKWVQDECLSLIIKTPYDDVKRLAIVCIGHLCRIHQKIEKDKVIDLSIYFLYLCILKSARWKNLKVKTY